MLAFSSSLTAGVDNTIVMHDLAKKGYYEIANTQFSQRDYQSLYNKYDNFLSEFYGDKRFSDFITLVDEQFKSSEFAKPYANAPMGFLHSENHKSNKSFFHYSKEYHEFLMRLYPEELAKYHVFNELLAAMSAIDEYTRHIFQDMIASADQKNRALMPVMYQDRTRLTIVTKVVKYEKSPKRASDFHFDFSALSLLLNNSDRDDEHLLISKYKPSLNKQDFIKAERNACNGKPHCTSVLFIPGLALRLVGVDIDPTPHTVEQVDEPRYAALAFAMLPYKHIQYDQIKVQLDSINTLNNE